MAPKRTRGPEGNMDVAAQPKRRQVTIDILSEDVLLEIFDHYVDPTRKFTNNGIEAWCTLVHVCQKWRNIVLDSPLRLNLRIRCYPTTPAKEKLDIWPALPIVLAKIDKNWPPKLAMDNIAAVFEQNYRICQINLSDVPTLQMGEILAAMHKPFPVLTDLLLQSDDETMSVDPDLFLGGSAPCLRLLHLTHIPFPGLPKLLLSATHLTHLRLFNISDSGYISPEAMVPCFSALTMLKTLVLAFESLDSFPIREHRPPPPPTRTLLPSLTEFQFYGINKYLEDLVVRIDTPLLDHLVMFFYHQFIPDIAQLTQFIDRTPKLKAHNEAHVFFQNSGVLLTRMKGLKHGLGISYRAVDLQVSSLAQACTSSLSPAFSATVERLYIYDNETGCRGDNRVESSHWLKFLRPFTSVKSLYLSWEIAPRIAPALQELIGEKVAEILPALQTLFVEDFEDLGLLVQGAIGSFISGRKFSGHPVAISHWEITWSDSSDSSD